MRRFAGLWLAVLCAVPSGAAEVAGQAVVAASPPPAACDAATPLTLVGLDTASGQVLLALPNGGWIELRLSPTPSARLFPGAAETVTGASIGAGPVFALLGCGPDCLQPAVWREGTFAVLGEPLLAPTRTTTAATYDAGGSPWIVLHEPSGAGVLTTRAFRLEAGEWVAQGVLRVTDTGHPGLLSIPDEPTAVVSGTGHFGRGEAARYWLEGLPDIVAGRRGEVVPLGGKAAAYIAADGIVYRTLDRGAAWRRAVWTPWSDTVVQPWRLGEDYDCEPPSGDLGLPLPLAWFDHRRPNVPTTIVLSEMTGEGAWRAAATVTAMLPGSDGAPLEITELIRLADRRWVLLAGCDASGTGATLVLAIAGSSGIETLRLPILAGPPPTKTPAEPTPRPR